MNLQNRLLVLILYIIKVVVFFIRIQIQQICNYCFLKFFLIQTGTKKAPIIRYG